MSLEERVTRLETILKAAGYHEVSCALLVAIVAAQEEGAEAAERPACTCWLTE